MAKDIKNTRNTIRFFLKNIKRHPDVTKSLSILELIAIPSVVCEKLQMQCAAGISSAKSHIEEISKLESFPLYIKDEDVPKYKKYINSVSDEVQIQFSSPLYWSSVRNNELLTDVLKSTLDDIKNDSGNTVNMEIPNECFESLESLISISKF